MLWKVPQKKRLIYVVIGFMRKYAHTCEWSVETRVKEERIADCFILNYQCDIKEVGSGPQVLKGWGDVRPVVVPPQAVLVRRPHLGSRRNKLRISEQNYLGTNYFRVENRNNIIFELKIGTWTFSLGNVEEWAMFLFLVNLALPSCRQWLRVKISWNWNCRLSSAAKIVKLWETTMLKI